MLTRAAEADLANIWDYTVEAWGFDQAHVYTLNVKAACQGLCSGERPSQSAVHIRAGYRKALVGRHTLYFEIQGNRIVIVRILHQSMDVGQQFGQ